ncbi:hypothetical protein Scep_003849 [Stephania cephalantha]|uniref:Uncharacterized protein n=1 Tax=Stephania cephalantha TaxID=152367 RepID=A0AAP0KTV2_9MAGN
MPKSKTGELGMPLSLRKSLIEREDDTHFDLGGPSKTNTLMKKPHQRLIEKPTKVLEKAILLIPKVERTPKMEVTTAPTQLKRNSSRLRKMKKPTVPPNIADTPGLIKDDDDNADGRLRPLQSNKEMQKWEAKFFARALSSQRGLPPPSRHEYEEVLRDRADVIREKNFKKMVYIQFEPEESVEGDEEMSIDDDDCDDSGEDDSEEGLEEEGNEFMGEGEAVRDPYDSNNEMPTQEEEREYVAKSEQVEREKTFEDRRESPTQTEPIPPSPTTDTSIDVKVYEEVVATPTIVTATHSHFETGQSEQQHQPVHSEEGHTHDDTATKG